MLACILTHFDSRHSLSSKNLPLLTLALSLSVVSIWSPSLTLIFSVWPFSFTVIFLSPSCRVMMVLLVAVIFFPLLSQQMKRAGGTDGCWQGSSSRSAEPCNCVPGKEGLVFVFLTCNVIVVSTKFNSHIILPVFITLYLTGIGQSYVFLGQHSL